jgi:hypothetical protein
MTKLLTGRLPLIVVAYMSWSLLACGDTTDPDGQLDWDNLAPGTVVAGHEAVTSFSSIPTTVLDFIRTNFRVYYGHTSHGSQIMTGLSMLAAESPDHTAPSFHEIGDDLGSDGDVSWATTTRAFLDSHPGEYNVVMWSWCGGVSSNTEPGINTYLSTMTQLETEYPEVVFIYMTGHLDGSGVSGNLYARNNQIRAYATANHKVLFDFADIESYDPNGQYYPDSSDDCGWCSNWCDTHDCPVCGSCAHSHCFNCYLKGKAFWWMMARVAGWEPSA